MTTATALPFKVSKAFKLAGVDMRPGDVCDVSMLSLQRIKNMEDTGYGLRVAAGDTITAKAKKKSAVAAPRKSVAKRSPRKATTARRGRPGASAKE